MPAYKSQYHGLITIIALMTMIGPFTIDSYLPSFPDIEAEFNISRAILSHSLGAYLIAFAFATLVFGPLADKFGRKGVILISLLIYLAASIGCALSNDYSSFIFYRLMQGMAAAGGLVAGRAIIRDVFNPQDAHHAMSKIMMLFAIAPAIAPVIGGWLHDWFGWHSVFYFLALYAFFVFFLVYLYVPETLDKTHRQSIHPMNVARVYGRTLTHRRFLTLVLIVACYFAGLFLYIVGAPTVIFDFLNLGTNDFAVLFVPMVCGLILGSWLSSRLAHRWPINKTIKLALVLMSIGTVMNISQAYWLTPSIVSTVVPLTLYTCGIGIAMPAMTVLALDCFPKNRGTASALQGFMQMMGNATIASVAVPLLSLEVLNFAIVQFILFTLALLLWWMLPAVTNN